MHSCSVKVQNCIHQENAMLPEETFPRLPSLDDFLFWVYMTHKCFIAQQDTRRARFQHFLTISKSNVKTAAGTLRFVVSRESPRHLACMCSYWGRLTTCKVHWEGTESLKADLPTVQTTQSAYCLRLETLTFYSKQKVLEAWNCQISACSLIKYKGSM